MKRALITGGAGFLGSHIAVALLKRDVEVVIYDLVPPSEQVAGSRFIKGDITDIDSLGEAFQGCDYIFHTAAIANIDDTRVRPVETMDVNVVGTARCLEAARRVGVKRFILASSIYVAGKLGSFYRVSKFAGELLCQTYYDEFQLPYTIVRYGSLYGRKANRWNLVYRLCREILESRTVNYYGTGQEVREFINVEDAARETVNVATQDEYACKAVLIAGHQRMSMREFFDLVNEILGYQVDIRYLGNHDHRHYKTTPYSFEPELPVRINMRNYVDINEGILGCLKEIQESLEGK
jgi:UDP-glucose 4-epimerase